ncbi:hypothetical protein QBC32DRAFT_344588 [Pseudoneurospora amorphoporcata]|uniref:Secreted protein n=1 Tax=Pseudoneurospora amorphoporcata TaxID=241081 RepID=A0AAN6NUA8_9PEZI|nr:hypothetical protein QBC32DRAFT_344588 [Pseudoneurospora amorphoporcata]
MTFVLCCRLHATLLTPHFAGAAWIGQRRGSEAVVMVDELCGYFQSHSTLFLCNVILCSQHKELSRESDYMK